MHQKVSATDIPVNENWSWNGFVDEMLSRADRRIRQNRLFDSDKVLTVRELLPQIQGYLDAVAPTPYLDDLSAKNLPVCGGRLSGIIDIDRLGFGDMPTFVAMTKVALMNMDHDVKYADYLLKEIRQNEIEYRAFLFYRLLYCVDFMGERGMRFLDKTVPGDAAAVKKPNVIFNILMEH